MIKVSIIGREKPMGKNEGVKVALMCYGFLSQREVSAIINKIAEVFSRHATGVEEDTYYETILGALDFHESDNENSIEFDYRPDEGEESVEK